MVHVLMSMFFPPEDQETSVSQCVHGQKNVNGNWGSSIPGFTNWLPQRTLSARIGSRQGPTSIVDKTHASPNTENLVPRTTPRIYPHVPFWIGHFGISLSLDKILWAVNQTVLVQSRCSSSPNFLWIPIQGSTPHPQRRRRSTSASFHTPGPPESGKCARAIINRVGLCRGIWCVRVLINKKWINNIYI